MGRRWEGRQRVEEEVVEEEEEEEKKRAKNRRSGVEVDCGVRLKGETPSLWLQRQGSDDQRARPRVRAGARDGRAAEMAYRTVQEREDPGKSQDATRRSLWLSTIQGLVDEQEQR